MRNRQSRSRQSDGHDEVPEYWVTYSDLLVTLLVVFALLLFLALARVEGQHASEARSRAAVKQAVETSNAAVSAAAEALGSRSVEYDPRTRTLTMKDEVLFGFGSSILRPEARDLIARIAVRFLPALLGDTAVSNHIDAIVVEGHTDTVGTYLSNLSLSQQRAQSVLTALIGATGESVISTRLQEVLVASGRSEVEALAMGSSYDAAKARRMVLRVRLRDAELLQQLLNTDSIAGFIR